MGLNKYVLRLLNRVSDEETFRSLDNERHNNTQIKSVKFRTSEHRAFGIYGNLISVAKLSSVKVLF